MIEDESNEGGIIELTDLGNAMTETKQVTPLPMAPDNLFGWGEFI